MSKKILFINQETTPYVPESAMALAGQRLPEKTQEKGYEIRTFMPKWGNINERRGQLHEVIRLSGLNICIDDIDHPLLIKVASIPVSRVQVYFIDNEEFFSKRQMTENEQGEEYTDNSERAIFFARGVLETVKKLRWAPDVIVCQGWMGAVVPLYLKKVFRDEPCFAETKIVTSLFTEQLKNNIGDKFKRCVAFNEVTEDTLNDYNNNFDFFELGKLAIDYSDAVMQASPTANSQLMDYAKSRDIPFLDFKGLDYDRILSFLDQLIEIE